MNILKSLVILLALSMAPAAFAETTPSQLKEILENRQKVVEQEIKTLKLKVKVEKSDKDAVDELAQKQVRLKELKKKIEIVKEQIKTEKAEQQAYKEYTELQSKLEKLNDAVDAIAADEDY